jgi:hypothetical protein
LETQKKTSFTTEREEDWVPRFYGNRIINPLESCGPKVFLFSGSAKLTLAFPPPSFLPSSHIFLNGKVMSWCFLDKPLLKSKGDVLGQPTIANTLDVPTQPIFKKIKNKVLGVNMLHVMLYP